MAAQPGNNQGEGGARVPVSGVGNHKKIRREENHSGAKKSADDGGNVCFVCNRSFRSPKSLFGHMRTHPERSWRGIRPPWSPVAEDKPSPGAAAPNPDAGEDLTADQSKEDPAIDSDERGFMAQPLPGWSRTAKRGGTGIATSTERNSVIPSSPSKLRSAPESSVLSFLVTVANYILASSSSSKSKRKVSDFRAKANPAEKDQALCNGTGLIKKLKTEVVFPIEKKQYECRDCGKSFSNPQALGGHRTSHRKGTTTTTTEPEEPSTDEGRLRALKEAQIPWCSLAGDELIKSSQENSPGSCCLTGKSDSSSSGDGKGDSAKIFPFDLNELPVVKEEEEGEGEMLN
ncbi:zinc finger protein ZAT9-like [Malania oleifera]|uniref:zinc finger protein ZAT9-like n=1 Tax=Malania oleifera TaxID=397392 RepID=UPI0025ADAA4A|nr:zinc finger protein ZAT9-like [Malania oleifera]